MTYGGLMALVDENQALPVGWAWATIGELCVVNPRKFDEPPSDEVLISLVPMAAVEAETGRMDTGQHVRYCDYKRKSLTPFQDDDVLFAKITPCMENGKIAIAAGLQGGRALGSTEFYVLRSLGAVTPRYLMHFLLQRSVREQAERNMTGAVGQRRVPRPYLEALRVPVPPLAEQHRIVRQLEIHLSRIESGTHAVRAARTRLNEMRKAVIVEAIPESVPDHWEITTVAEAGVVDLGRQRHPAWHAGPNMLPYLRVANVFEDRIDTTDVKQMDFSDTGTRYHLEPGDVLLNEGQSPHLLGRPAIYRGEPAGAAFQNTLLRFRPHPGISSEWALLVFRRHMHAGRFMREARITTNIAHLSSARLKTVEFPVPPASEQDELVAATRAALEAVDRMDEEVSRALDQAESLRASLMTATLSGGLVPQDEGDEPASVTIGRVYADHAASLPVPKRRKPQTRAITPPDQEELPL